jgi:hypothetical protein
MELKIYNIPEALEEAFSAISVDEETGEIVGKDVFDNLVIDAQMKVEGAAKYCKVLDAQINAMKEASNAIQKRIKQAEKAQEFFKACILRYMETTGTKKIEAPDILIKTGKNPPSVEIYDESLIPADFVKSKMVTSISKTDIKNAIKAGEEVPGARLTESTRVIIK